MDRVVFRLGNQTFKDNALSFEDAVAQLGPLLVGADWIEKLTERENWLVRRYDPFGCANAGLLMGGGASIRFVGSGGRPFTAGLTGIAAEAAKAHERNETMLSQHEQAEEWLAENDLLFEMGDETSCVPAERFATAIAKLALPRSAQPDTETDQDRSVSTAPGVHVKPRKRDVEKDALRRNLYQSVIASAKRRWPTPPRPSPREMAKELSSEKFNTGAEKLSDETILKILNGTYPAAAKLGVGALG